MSVLKLSDYHVPRALRGHLCADTYLVPRFWATIWHDSKRLGFAEATNRSALAAVDGLYRTANEVLETNLDRAIAEADFASLRVCLSAHLQKLNNTALQRRIDLSKSWISCLSFVEDVLDEIGVAEDWRWHDIQASLARLKGSYGQLRPSQTAAPAPIRSLPARVVEELYEIFDPMNERNPFRCVSERYRNFLIFLILLHLGLRRSELLLLALNSFQTEYDALADREICWMIVDYPMSEMGAEDDEADFSLDPRAFAPTLKNGLARRLLPLSPEILSVKDAYVGGFRQRMEWPYLLASQKGRPLSMRRLNEIFEIATAKLSTEAKALLRSRGKETVQPHDLRHTCAVRYLAGYRAAGHSDSDAVEKLRVFFGWNENSNMPRRYARAYYETDYDTVWHDRYDAYVDALRSLEGVQ